MEVSMERTELVRELQQEHQAIRESLARVRLAVLSGRAGRRELKQLRHQLDRHMAREDSQVMPFFLQRRNEQRHQSAFEDVRRIGGLLPVLFDSCEQAEDEEAFMAYLRLMTAIRRRQHLEKQLLYPALCYTAGSEKVRK